MVTAALLCTDSRLVFQIESWMRELGDTVRVEKFTSAEELRASAARDIEGSGQSGDSEIPLDAEDIGSGKPSGEGGLQIRLLIVDFDLIAQRPFQTLKELKEIVAEIGRQDSAYPPKVLLMTFEGGGLSPEKLRHEVVDDLLMKPLDRSLFLQKIELLVADKPNVKPSFLFRQKTDMTVEAGKDGVVDEISEFAVAIRNPTPLAEGVFATLHGSVFGEKSDSRVLGRVYKSVRHPTHEGEYLIRFAFFGLNGRQLSQIRKHVRGQQTMIRTKASGSETRALGKEELPWDKKRKIAVIDMNGETFNEIRSAMEDSFKDVGVRSFPSYTKFLAELVKLTADSKTGTDSSVPTSAKPPSEDPKAQQASQPRDGPADGPTDGIDLAEMVNETPSSKPPESALPKGRRLHVILNADTRELVGFDPMPKSEERILGHQASHWLEKPDLWFAHIEAEDRAFFEEFMAYVQTGAKGSVYFRMKDDSAHVAYLEANGTMEKSGETDGLALINLELKELEAKRWIELADQDSQRVTPESFRFEAIYIDGAMLRTEPEGWLTGLREALTKARVLRSENEMPKVFILGDEKSSIRPESYKASGITDFIYKPLDRKFLVQKAFALFQNLQYLKAPETSPFIPCELPVKLSKDVRMDEVSEYGLSIVHPSPFREKVFMRFFSPLFGDDAEEEGVIARCTHCEKVGEGKEQSYHCHFVFFGTSEEMLSRVRTWIREDYVSRKDGSGG